MATRADQLRSGTLRIVEIEHWALRVIDRVEQGLPIEDSQVELKAKWIDRPNHVARLIAGHCNANAGSSVLWLIGVDEKSGVVGVEYQDMAQWWATVSAEFDEQPPTFQDVVLAHNGRVVVALLFNTDRAPFVVRNEKYGQQGGGGGPVAREVPWREGTSVRSATRSDLVRILVPISALPTLELRDATARSRMAGTNNDGRELYVIVAVYAVVPLGVAVILPDHLTRGKYSIPARNLSGDLQVELIASSMSGSLRSLFVGRQSSSDSTVHTVHQGDKQIIIEGPGFFRFSCRADIPDIETETDWESVGPLEVTLGVRPADTDLSTTVHATLIPYFVPAERPNARPGYEWRLGARTTTREESQGDD